MINLVWSLFKKQQPLVKVLTIIIIIAISYSTILLTQKAYYKYKYYQQIEKNYNAARDSIIRLNTEIKDLTLRHKIETEKAKKKSKDINDKLKQDEEDINNRIVTDDELKEFLSRYDN